MLRGIKVRLYPNREQIQMLEQHFGVCRLVYNLGLEAKIIAYQQQRKSLSKYDLVNQLPDLRQDYDFIRSVKAECLQNVFDNLDNAYQKFFKGGGFPRFKSKKDKQSFIQKQTIKIVENKVVFLSKTIKFRCSHKDMITLHTQKLKRVTYSKANNKYYASVLIDDSTIEKFPKVDRVVGIDLGLKSFLVDSDGNKIENPRFLRKSLKKLKFLQRQASKKKKGSNNKKKAYRKIANKYEKIRNQREFFLHNLSSKLISENQVVIAESLKVENMIKNHKLALSISDASWSKFVEQLRYKAEMRGRVFHQIDTFYPSSKTCSRCLSKKKTLKLSERIYRCDVCGHVIDRDLNAAINIKRIGLEALGMNQPEVKSVEKVSVGTSKKQKFEQGFIKVDCLK